jgi:hypothetical protein
MPDPLVMSEALAAAFVVALALTLTGRIGGGVWLRFAAVAGIVGVAAGWFVGACVLGLTPNFPPREDQDRLLLVLLPCVAVVEIFNALLPRRRWLGWALRCMIAGAAARLLLHQSIYLTGSSDYTWTSTQAWLILGGLGLLLAANWALFERLSLHSAGAVLALALVAAGAGLTIMLSGYASGGQLGLPLAGSLLGLAVARQRPATSGAVGIGIVGLFALLVMGRFFGNLTNLHAAVLFSAPLLGWLPEAVRLGPRLRATLRAGVVLLPVAFVVISALQKFNADARRPASTPAAGKDGSVDDYSNFGK